jgi:hypothetical protein
MEAHAGVRLRKRDVATMRPGAALSRTGHSKAANSVPGTFKKKRTLRLHARSAPLVANRAPQSQRY